MTLGRIRLERTTWLYLAIALVATAPAWIVKYPPMEDVPFHLATIRIIHSIHDPAFGFDRDFVLTLGRTQYVLYYLLGSALSYAIGVVAANVVLMSAYLAGTVLGMRALLAALGKDERACLFVVPLLINILFLYGLFPFLFGVPVMLFALATAARYFAAPTLARGVTLGALALALFYCHVFPFCLFGIGFAAMFPWGRPTRWPRAIAPAAPALAALAWWTLSTDAGKLTRGALLDSSGDPRKTIEQSIARAHEYFLDVFRDPSDDVIAIALFVVALLAVVLAQGDSDPVRARRARAYGLVPIACVVFYFLLPDEHGYVSIIAARFPVLFAITALPLLRFPRGLRGGVVTALAVAIALASTWNTCAHFRAFAREVGDFDAVLASMEPQKRVCALIFERDSKITKLAPYLHFGSYYQLSKGGVVKFSYAGFAHWPVDFLPGRYPPPGAAARRLWEWEPHLVAIEEIYPYYDYVLTRGDGFHPPPGTYEPRFEKDGWRVWERK